jgi:hypothetical protein
MSTESVRTPPEWCIKEHHVHKFNCVAFITMLVIGILGLTGQLNISPAASYVLLGISGGIALVFISRLASGGRFSCLHDKSKSSEEAWVIESTTVESGCTSCCFSTQTTSL